MPTNDLAEVIREAIRASGKSAGQLAAVSTVHKAVTNRFLAGTRTITVETAGKLLAALGCTVAIKGPKADAPLVPPGRKRRKSTGKPTKG